MIQKIEDLETVEVGRLGTINTPMLSVYAYRGKETGEFYGLIVDHLRSGDDQKPRKIMFSDLKALERIATAVSSTEEPSREL